MSEFSDLISDGLTDFMDVAPDSFQWNGGTYAAVIDHVMHTLTTQKSFFPDQGYPKCGDAIVIAGKKFQVIKKGNSEIRATDKGFSEDPPFIDDPNDPALDLTFDHFSK